MSKRRDGITAPFIASPRAPCAPETIEGTGGAGPLEEW